MSKGPKTTLTLVSFYVVPNANKTGWVQRSTRTPWKGVYTAAVLDAWRIAENSRNFVTEGVVRHYNRVTLVDALEREVITLRQALFEVH